MIGPFHICFRRTQRKEAEIFLLYLAMQCFLYIFLFSLFLPTICACQCISFSEIKSDGYYTYDKKYKDNKTIRLFPCAELIYKKVRTLKVYPVLSNGSKTDNLDTLDYSVTFDKRGRIVQKAFYNGYYFVRSDTFRNDDTVKMIVTKYTHRQVTERIDSIWFSHFFYNKKGDYTISFILEETKSYKSGKHINERNVFFNGQERPNATPHHTNFKTNYSEDNMYLSSDVFNCLEFSAYNKEKDVDGHLKTLKKHPFVRKPARKVFNPKYYIEGENYSGLLGLSNPLNWCGYNSSNINIEYQTQDSISKNSKGLDDTFFIITKKMVSINGESPKLTETTITPRYTIRYEYYQD